MRFARRKTSPKAGGGYGPLKQGKHTANPGWKHGQHWVECQRCGLDYYVSDIKVQWDGLVTCLSCWEPRHPQDFVRGVHDDMRPRGPGNPVGINEVDVTFPVSGTFNNDLAADESEGVAPEAADADLIMWLDFSEQEGNFVFSDLAGSTAITNGDQIRRAVNRATGVSAGVAFMQPQSLSDSFAPFWDSGVRGANGAMDGDSSRVAATCAVLSNAGALGGLPDPKTYIAVVEVPSANTGVIASYIMGPTNSNGHNMGIAGADNGAVSEIETMTFIPLQTTNTMGMGSWLPKATSWFMFVFRTKPLSGNDSDYRFNNQDTTVPWPGSTHDWNDQPMTSLRVGCGNAAGFTIIEGPWNAYIGELLIYSGTVTDAKIKSLYLWMQSKWTLSATPP